MMVRIGPITLLFFLTAACGFIPYGGDKTPQIKLEEVVFDSMHIGGAQDRPCGIIEARYSPGRDKKSIEQWRATARPNARWLGSDDLHNGVFVGIAISGGGSRSANFALATLLELDKLGVLNYVSAISSVSGGRLQPLTMGYLAKTSQNGILTQLKSHSVRICSGMVF